MARERRHAVKISPEDEARFNALRMKGDRAVEAWSLNDAVVAYRDALDIKFDARLSGRLGLVLLMFMPDPELDTRAAGYLLTAVEHAAGISQAERRQFFDAYAQVRRRICRLDVTLNEVDAVVTIGSKKTPKSEGAFWTFIEPGKIDLVASLDGRDDIKQTAECIPSQGDIALHFEFPPLPGEVREVTTVIKEPVDPIIIRDEIPTDALRMPEPTKKDAPPISRFGVGIGPAIVIGAAPSPSFGVSITGLYRRDAFSGIAIARGAWSIGDVKGRPIDIFSASAIVGPCVRWQWLDGCALGGAIFFEQRMVRNAPYLLETGSTIIPPFGLGIGATYAINAKLSARIFADAAALTRDSIIRILPSEGDPSQVWQTQRFIFSISASLFFGH